MARTKQSSCLNVAVTSLAEDCDRDAALEQAQMVLDGIVDGTITSYANVTGRLDSLEGRTFTARPVGLSIPGVWDKLKSLEVDAQACDKSDFYDGVWDSIPSAVACLKEQTKHGIERMLTSLKAADSDAFDDVANYISANTGASLTWDES